VPAQAVPRKVMCRKRGRVTQQEVTRKPRWPLCSTSGCIGVRRDGQEGCLAHVSSEARKVILAALKPSADLDLRGTPIDPELLSQLLAALRPEGGPPTIGSAEFDEAQFTGDAEFDEAQFTRDAEFRGARFTGVAAFDSAQFTEDAGFSHAQFGGHAGFSHAQFSGNAWFSGARFSGVAGFNRAQFTGVAAFDSAQFSGVAGFSHAQFAGDAEFYLAQFAGDAVFWMAQFTGIAGFWGAQFTGDAAFDMAVFRRGGLFGPVLAASSLSLDDATFEQDIRIEAVGAELSCVRTRFAEAATLRLRRAQVVLDGAVFAKPSTIAFASDPFRHYDPGAGREVESFGEGPVARAEGGRWSRPRLLSLRGVDVAVLTLSELDLEACLFQGAHHLDQLRIEGARPFANTPPAWRLRLGRWRVPAWRRWSRRQTLAEEHHWHAEPSPPGPGRWSWLARPAWHGPACQTPGWVVARTRQRVQRLTPDRLAVMYRALRKAQEDSKNEPGAADFYYSEMEMRRRDRHTPWAERIILWLYWLVSGYGLRGLRALASLTVVVVGLAALLHVAGYAIPPSPASIWGSLLYAAGSTLSIGDDQVRLTGWGKLLRIALRLAGPVLLGLALLSIRNRVKR
jgi:hypothetical protein